MSVMLPIVVDIMGGDYAPKAIIDGALSASGQGIPVELVGLASAIENIGSLELHEASQVIGMAEEPGRAVRTMKDSSIVRGAERVRDGQASAMVSAGNTGAVAAAALLRMKRIPGVVRPAIATALPVPGRAPKILLDSGAMADCQPDWLLQFAQMGSAFSRIRYGIEKPQVGLLSIGEEAEKGNQITKAAHVLLRNDTSIDFIGNVEGRDILDGAVDVVVADGFTGNVALKTIEGTIKFLVNQIISILLADGVGEVGKEALGLLSPIASELNPEAVGGAMLLGVNGIAIISHGSAGPLAIENAIKLARDMVDRDLIGALAEAVAAT
ncbi:MAG TPA: phosphate acyltransferase PlsX [Acidimicrobiaceae bacterium]|nr:phosphate--acyl-ACP acyltransferase [Actinomycetota bacterium]NCG41077.1 phosphate acyltransferase PlsX [Actinomycetota bacterium]HAN08334.1 phosphate acyltransferase PlsX [Acidimicrobiaceae bacterium]